MSKHLSVWWDRKLVGDLALNQYGEPEFTYANTWIESDDARAISVSLPLRTEPFNRRETLPFLKGLLPEAAQRTAIAQALGVSERNEFRLFDRRILLINTIKYLRHHINVLLASFIAIHYGWNGRIVFFHRRKLE